MAVIPFIETLAVITRINSFTIQLDFSGHPEAAAIFGTTRYLDGDAIRMDGEFETTVQQSTLNAGAETFDIIVSFGFVPEVDTLEYFAEGTAEPVYSNNYTTDRPLGPFDIANSDVLIPGINYESLGSPGTITLAGLVSTAAAPVFLGLYPIAAIHMDMQFTIDDAATLSHEMILKSNDGYSSVTGLTVLHDNGEIVVSAVSTPAAVSAIELTRGPVADWVGPVCRLVMSLTGTNLAVVFSVAGTEVYSGTTDLITLETGVRTYLQSSGMTFKNYAIFTAIPPPTPVIPPAPLVNNTQQGDVLLFQSNDEGEINVGAGLIEMSGGLRTAAYLSLFGGNSDDNGQPDNELTWWGNIDETDPARQYRSETQYLIESLPATSGNLKRIEQAASRDLNWFLTSGAATSVTAVASIPDIKKLRLIININAEGIEQSFEFLENWKAEI